ncbi:MAG: hypothetical protein ACRCZO_12465 [Cetobacterium sp.]
MITIDQYGKKILSSEGLRNYFRREILWKIKKRRNEHNIHASSAGNTKRFKTHLALPDDEIDRVIVTIRQGKSEGECKD